VGEALAPPTKAAARMELTFIVNDVAAVYCVGDAGWPQVKNTNSLG
jgi:hypothetical protein